MTEETLDLCESKSQRFDGSRALCGFVLRCLSITLPCGTLCRQLPSEINNCGKEQSRDNTLLT
jgi:hypothetical protein